MPRVRGNRTPSHSGSWYEANEHKLSSQIRGWLDSAPENDHGRVRAVIAPHAGYRYCGHVMAYAYKYIRPRNVKRVFLLGPSHHFYSHSCHLSPHARYSTPLGDAEVDTEVYAALHSTGKFLTMSADADEAEHSLELHMSYLMECMRGHEFTLVPIVVGALTPEGEASYGQLLAPYLADPDNFFILSSDFCHWGTRFSFTFHREDFGAIHDSIRWLDHQGMALIEAADPEAFTKYLQSTRNTICGRHPIAVFLQALKRQQEPSVRHAITFTRYDQSHQCTTTRDSSVSYASAVVVASDWMDEEDAGPAL